MAINSRNKGRQAEQQVARLLSDYLGITVTRNWAEQAAQGGCDLIGIDGWAIEVKHCKAYSSNWWTQAAEQAERINALPALIYRITGTGRGQSDLDKWKVEIRAADLITDLKFENYRITMSLGCWLAYVREQLNQEQQ